VKAPPLPTQEFWADISIRSVSELFTWSMYRKGGATTTSVHLKMKMLVMTKCKW